MIKLLIRTFIKNPEDVKNPDVRASYGVLAGGLGIVCNLLLFIGKLAAGLVMNSIAVISDAFNNLSDLGSSLISAVSAKLSCQEPDEKHPLGHGRFEYIASLSVAAIILVVGVELGKTSFKKILSPEVVSFQPVICALLALSVLVKAWMYFYNRYIGRKIDSTLLLAAAQDSIGDVAATSVVILSTILGQFLSFPVDGIMGLVVSLLILRAGIGIAKKTVDLLMGVAPERKLVRELEELILSGEGIHGVHDLVIHNYGPGRNFASAHAEVPVTCNVVAVHEIIDALEEKAHSAYGVTLVLHMDPIETENPEVEALREMTAEVIHSIDESYAFHDFRITNGANHINLIFDLVVPLSHHEKDFKQKAEEIRAELCRRDPRVAVVMKIDRQ